MKKFIIDAHAVGKPRARFCPCCGLNTNLLSDKQKISDGEKVFCRECFGKDVKKTVKPGDFYVSMISVDEGGNLGEDSFYQNNLENRCRGRVGLPYIEIAFLHGEKSYEEDNMYLDMYYDKETGSLYFRMSLCEDTDPWYGYESYAYVRFPYVLKLLNKNDIHIFDGITAKDIEIR